MCKEENELTSCKTWNESTVNGGFELAKKLFCVFGAFKGDMGMNGAHQKGHVEWKGVCNDTPTHNLMQP